MPIDQHPNALNPTRLWRGIHSAVSNFAFPLGHWWLGGLSELSNPSRQESGLVLVLPGIEGRSPMNWSIAKGLGDGGVRAAIRVHDWTTGWWPLCLYHLRAGRRNRRQAEALARAIAAYQDNYPERPVYLVGHSGGAGLVVWTLEALPHDRTIAAAFLLAPTLSPGYRLTSALRRCERGIWSFWSPLDFLFLAGGTALFRTIDNRHRFAAGCCGFRRLDDLNEEELEVHQSRLHQVCFRPAFLRHFHHGGHLGWANRVFVAEAIAPLLEAGSRTAAPTSAGPAESRHAASSPPG